MNAARIVIIGATSGIGKELALYYARQGNRVGITGRREYLLKEVQSQYPASVITRCFDVAGSENILHVNKLIEELGGLDLLIYNAGFGEIDDQLILENEMATVKINVLGFVEIAGYAFTYFVKQGYGHIALTSSVAALRGSSVAPAYSASKAFMSNYAEGLSIKAYKTKKKIFITDVKPGFVKTKMAKGHGQFWVASPQKAVKQIVQAIAKKKRVAYVTHRWWLVAQVVKRLPFWLYKRIA